MNGSRFDQIMVLASLLAFLFVVGCDSPREERRELRRALFGVCDAYLNHNDPNTKTMLANLYGVCFQVPAEYWGFNPMYGSAQVPIDLVVLAANWVDGELVPNAGPVAPETFEAQGIKIVVVRNLESSSLPPFGESPNSIELALARDPSKVLFEVIGKNNSVEGYRAAEGERARFADYLFALSDRSIRDPDGRQPLVACMELDRICNTHTRIMTGLECNLRFSMRLASEWPEIREQTIALCKSAIKDVRLDLLQPNNRD